MPASATRPRVYISSTIFDFADLRSALRHHLKELGYEVMLSEYNDFQKPIDKNSYDACLSAIDGCDYYILLIGSRAGGWFSAIDKTTITQMEYRRAYERAKNKQIQILAFVRESVWNAKEDRRGLLGSALPEDKAAGSLATFSSKIVQDADFIFDFLHEVARISEMKDAVKTGSLGPIANWVHTFSGFEDIADVLKVAMRTTRDVGRIAAETNLRRELIENARGLMTKFREGTVVANLEFMTKARNEIPLNLLEDNSIPHEHANSIGIYLVGALPRVSQVLTTDILDDALRSGITLKFDSQIRSLRF